MGQNIEGITWHWTQVLEPVNEEDGGLATHSAHTQVPPR